MLIGLSSLVWLIRPSDSPIAAQGETIVRINKAGLYTLWEHALLTNALSGTVQTRSTNSFIISNRSGTVIPTEDYSDFNISQDDATRNSILRVQFDEPGEYRVSATGSGDGVFHLLPGNPSLFIWLVFLATGTGLVVLAMAAIFGLFAFVKLATRKW